MTEHTPTPWAFKPLKHDDWGFIRGANGNLACIARDPDEKDQNQHRVDRTDPFEANAAFIVKAVNSHDALVNALGRIEQFNGGQIRSPMQDIAKDALAAVSSPGDQK